MVIIIRIPNLFKSRFVHLFISCKNNDETSFCQRVCSDVVINVFIYRQNHILLRDKTFYAGMGWYLQ